EGRAASSSPSSPREEQVGRDRGERTQQEPASSPQPSLPSNGGEGEIKSLMQPWDEGQGGTLNAKGMPTSRRIGRGHPTPPAHQGIGRSTTVSPPSRSSPGSGSAPGLGLSPTRP